MNLNYSWCFDALHKHTSKVTCLCWSLLVKCIAITFLAFFCFQLIICLSTAAFSEGYSTFLQQSGSSRGAFQGQKAPSPRAHYFLSSDTYTWSIREHSNRRLLFLSLPQTRGEYHSLIAAFKFGYNHPRHCYRCNLPDSISLVFDAANYNTVPAKYSKHTVKVYGCRSTSSASVEVEFSESDTVTELASPSFSPNAIVQLSPVIINRLKCTERRLTALAVWVNSTELPVAEKKHWWWWCSSAD